MEREKIKVYDVYSKIEDKSLSAKHTNEELINSPIWKECLHSEEVEIGFEGFVYKIGFVGTTPVQVNKVERFSKNKY